MNSGKYVFVTLVFHNNTLNCLLWKKLDKLSKYMIDSYAKYAGQITPEQTMTSEKPAGKKGLGGFPIRRGFESDLDDLNVSSVTMNITLTSFMYTQLNGNAHAHTYGDKTYFSNQAAGTTHEDSVFDIYKSVIGILNRSEVVYN